MDKNIIQVGRLAKPIRKKVIRNNARIYKVMANEKRLEILNFLRGREASVEQIANEIDIRLANASQHLSILRSAQLVKIRKQGLNVFYSLTDESITDACGILAMFQKKIYELEDSQPVYEFLKETYPAETI